VALQQSLASVQFWPALRHASPSQTPAEHDMLQQSPYAEHGAPPARHLPAGGNVLLPESPLPASPPPELPLEPLLVPAMPPASPPLPWAPLPPVHPSSDATTRRSPARTTKTAQECLIVRATLMVHLCPASRSFVRTHHARLRRVATLGLALGAQGWRLTTAVEEGVLRQDHPVERGVERTQHLRHRVARRDVAVFS
jgi:hypothetical protein